MPIFGPWITPPLVTTSGTVPLADTVFTRHTGAAMASFTAACESPDSVSRNGLFLAGGNNISLPFFCGNVPIAVQLDALAGLMSDVTPTLPPDVSGVDYDPADPVGDNWVASAVSYTMPFYRVETGSPVDFTDLPMRFRLVDPATLTELTSPWPPSPGFPEPPGVSLPQPPQQVDLFYTGTDLGALPSLSSVHLPVGGYDPLTSNTPTFTGSFTLALSDYGPVFGLTQRWAVVVVHFDAQVDHPTVPSSWTVDVRVQIPTLNVFEYFEGVSLEVSFTYQPRRYRFIRTVLPPLRQFPRDDFLGAAPRQGKTNGPTSVQGSTRQGWRGTYR